MKHPLKTLIGTLSLSAVALTASAQVSGESSPAGTPPPEQSQEQSQDPKPVLNSTGNQPGDRISRPIAAVKADEFIGKDIVNRQGEQLGSVAEIAVDVESGRLVGVILSTGGFLGIGASETVVPPGAFVLDSNTQRLQLDANKDRLLAAPRFDTSEWSGAFTTERLAAVYEYFGQESSFDFVDESDQARKPFTLPQSRLTGIQRGSEIIGLTVVTVQDEKVGDVSEIMLDLSAGRIIALVVTSGDFLEIENVLSAIPASSFHFSTDRETLQIKTNRSELTAAPHFKADRWPDFTRAETVSAIFSAHSVEPYAHSGAATDDPHLTIGSYQSAGSPATQGGNSADMATTSAIRREIRATENLSLNARNVSVITNQGHTTLRGPVDTTEEKQLIGEIANRNSREAGVKNLLVVKTTATQSE